MSSFIRIFDEYDIGVDTLTDWTRETGSASTYIAENTDYYRRELGYSSGAISSNFSFDPAGSVDKTDVRGLFKIPDATNNTIATVFARQQSGALSGYFVGFTNSSGVYSIRLIRIIAGSVTLTDVMPDLSWSPGDVWWARISVDGSAIKGKAWKRNETEPGWLAELSDTTFATGKAATRISSAGTKVFCFTVGTNGDVSLEPDVALTASPLTTASPAIAALSLGVVCNLLPEDVVVSTPELGTPALVPNPAFIASELVTNVVYLEVVPAFGLQYNTAVDVVVSSPVIGAATLSQVEVIDGADIVTDIAYLEAIPAFGLSEYYPVSLTIGPLSIGGPALHQDHALAAAALAVTAPILGTPVLAARTAAVPLTVAAPELGTPLMQLAVPHLTAPMLIVGRPQFGSFGLVQSHALTPVSLAIGVPVIGRPAWISMFAVGIEVGSPTFVMEAQPRNWHRREEDILPDTGEPIMEMIFSNYNDKHKFYFGPGLVGRTDEVRGPVQLIDVAPPLLLTDNRLKIDQTLLLNEVQSLLNNLQRDLDDAQTTADADRFL